MIPLPALDDTLGTSVFCRGVAAEVDPAPKLAGATDNGQQLVEIIALDDGIESDARDPHLPHSGNRSHDPGAQPGNAARLVVTLVEIIERDVELVDPRFPQRARPLGRQHATVGDERHVLEADRLVHRRDYILQIAPQCRLAAGECNEHGIEEARGISEGRELAGFGGRIGFPVVAEAAARVAAHRDFEMHQHGPPRCREICVLREEHGHVPRLELPCQHVSRSSADAIRACARSSTPLRIRRRRGEPRPCPGRW